MSRSRNSKCGKVQGYVFTSNRPGNQATKFWDCVCRYCGKAVKVMTHRIERRNAKRMEEER